MILSEKSKDLIIKLSELAIKHKAYLFYALYGIPFKGNCITVKFKSSSLGFARKREGDDIDEVLTHMIQMIETEEKLKNL